ncbi:hypothetical protein AAG570_004674 [Ranatra chinensis]|uniref:Uncharacterized protein n=1 Tax=Ranatra chinensis TaxID=642074 RepID=A0ABD0YE63_9HEMI
MVLKMCMERRELENTLSWLSTFGGAFSALGDSIERCALVAGKISLRQLGIAIRLGDPFTVIRCKLYCALSFIQLGRFKEAAEIVKTQYKLANSGPVVDEKVVAMCHGIWAKLRYDRRQSKLKKRHPD